MRHFWPNFDANMILRPALNSYTYAKIGAKCNWGLATAWHRLVIKTGRRWEISNFILIWRCQIYKTDVGRTCKIWIVTRSLSRAKIKLFVSPVFRARHKFSRFVSIWSLIFIRILSQKTGCLYALCLNMLQIFLTVSNAFHKMPKIGIVQKLSYCQVKHRTAR